MVQFAKQKDSDFHDQKSKSKRLQEQQQSRAGRFMKLI